MSQLRDLGKQKPRGKTDENLIAEVARLESAITLAKDDLVRAGDIFLDCILCSPHLRLTVECLQTSTYWY